MYLQTDPTDDGTTAHARFGLTSADTPNASQHVANLPCHRANKYVQCTIPCRRVYAEGGCGVPRAAAAIALLLAAVAVDSIRAVAMVAVVRD